MTTATSTTGVADTPTTEAMATHSRPSWLTSLRAFWMTTLLMGVWLLLLIPVIDNGYIAIPDEGVYSAQAAALAAGSWKTDRPAPKVDVQGYFDPVGSTAIVGDLRIPYGRHPLYGLTLSEFYRLGGQVGMLGLSVLGGLAAAVATGLIARQIKPIYGIPALLLTGIGSPLLFNSLIVSAHNIATALAGFMILSAICYQRNGSPWMLAPTALTATLIPMFRSEGSIFIGATAVALVLLSAPIPKRRSVQWRQFSSGAVIGIFGITGYLIDIWATRLVIPFSGFYSNPSEAIGGDQSGPLKAAWIALLQPWNYGGDATFPAITVVGSIAIAAIALRMLPKFQLLPISLSVIAAACAGWWFFADPTLVTGLVAAMPVLVFGIVWLRRSDLANPVVTVLAATSGIALLGLLATIYSDGGAAQWGGRLIQIVLPSLIPLAVLGIDNARKVMGATTQSVFFISIMVVALCLSALSLKANRAARSGSRNLVYSMTDAIEANTKDRTLALFARGFTDGSARAFWQVDNDLNLLSSQFSASYLIVERAQNSGYDRVVLITDAPDKALEKADRKWDRRLDLQRGEVDGYLANYRVFIFSKPKG